MEKGKKVILISHCILNQNTVVNAWERAKGPLKLGTILMESDFGIIQLPCPEFFCLGLNRPPLEFEDYNGEKHRKKMEKILENIFWQLEKYIENDYSLSAVIGINESPNCNLSGRKGVFMEIIYEKLKSLNLNPPFIEVPTDYGESINKNINFEKKLREFLKEL